MPVHNHFQYQVKTEPVFIPVTAIFEPQWHYGWSLPVRQKIDPREAAALAASGLFFVGPTTGEIILADKWFAPFSDPIVKSKRRLADGSQQSTTIDLNPRVSFGWNEALSEPVRIKPRLPEGEQQSLAWQPAPDPFAAVGWFNWLNDPVRLKLGLPAGEQQALALNPLPFVSFSWFEELSKPRRLDRPGLPGGEQQVLAFEPAPFVSFSWYGWLTEPVRLKPGLGAPLQQFFAIDTSVIPLQELIEWFASLSEPVRLKPGLSATLQQVLAWPPRLLPTPTITGTLNAVEAGDSFLGGGTSFNPPVRTKLGFFESALPGNAGLIEKSS